ncbi:hypothetical protein L1887_28689 [Cichorium endivia]|nr:hypothetical protein L1887_28689 [Cichorium endivia]
MRLADFPPHDQIPTARLAPVELHSPAAVLNPTMLYWTMSNAIYVQGYALDGFAKGLWALHPVHQNKVGMVIDA